MGDPVVLVHGLYGGASSEEFEHNIYILSRKFYVYAIDLLGFGYSDKPAMRYRAELYPTLLHDFIRSVVRSPAHIVAAGASCAYAATLAAEHPSFVQKMILLSPEDNVRQSLLRRRLAFPLGEAFRLLLLTPPFRWMFQEVMSGEWEVSELLRRSISSSRRIRHIQLERLRELAREPGVLNTYASMEAGFLFTSLAEQLPKVKCPTLFLCGREVSSETISELNGFAHMTPGSRIEYVDRAGLWVHTERPVEVNRLIVDFLNDSAEHASHENIKLLADA
jgi:pimeloyl-ACP methyl ester carboxylesterase